MILGVVFVWGFGGGGAEYRKSISENNTFGKNLNIFSPACQQLIERPHPSEILWLSAWKELVNLSFCLRQRDFKQSGYHFHFFFHGKKKIKSKFFCGERLISLLENMILLKTLSLALLLTYTRISKPPVHATIVKIQFYKSCL